jgi:tetratricopeptide (TPR) repeat protein
MDFTCKLITATILCFSFLFAQTRELAAQEPQHFLNGKKVSKGFIQAMDQGRQLEDEKKSRAALQEYQKALRLEPKNSDALSYCANISARLGKNNDAFKYYQQLVKQEPKNEDALFSCADTLVKAGRITEAIRFYDSAAQLNPKNPEAYYRCANCLMQLNRPCEALIYYEKSAVLNPGNPHAYLDCAETLIRLNKPKAAIPCLEKVRLATDWFDEAAWFLESTAYASLGQNEQAAKICEEFTRKFPGHEACTEMQRRIQILRKNTLRRFSANVPGQCASYLYEIDALRWRTTLPINVYIEQGTQVRFWKPQHNQIVRKAFMDWQECSSGLIGFNFVNSPQTARIILCWTATSADLPPHAGGQTQYCCAPSGAIERAGIRILTAGKTDSPMSDDLIAKIALHEVGHALGINGHSAMDSDVMYYTATTSSISERDRRTLLEICRQKPSAVSRPSSISIPAISNAVPREANNSSCSPSSLLPGVPVQVEVAPSPVPCFSTPGPDAVPPSTPNFLEIAVADLPP